MLLITTRRGPRGGCSVHMAGEIVRVLPWPALLADGAQKEDFSQ
jgi:hypothetical protein